MFSSVFSTIGIIISEDDFSLLIAVHKNKGQIELLHLV